MAMHLLGSTVGPDDMPSPLLVGTEEQHCIRGEVKDVAELRGFLQKAARINLDPGQRIPRPDVQRHIRFMGNGLTPGALPGELVDHCLNRDWGSTPMSMAYRRAVTWTLERRERHVTVRPIPAPALRLVLHASQCRAKAGAALADT